MDHPSPEETPKAVLGRREALKRAAQVAGALWVVPTIQTIRMDRAFAQGSPTEVCYSVKFDPGSSCDDHTFHCLDPNGGLGGCAQDVVVDENGPGGTWIVHLPAACRFLEGFSKCARDLCEPAQAPAGAFTSVTFSPCRRPDGREADISEIEFTFCCTGS